MTPWVRRLLLANVVVYLILNVLQVAPFRMFTFVPAELLHRPWGLITYMFLHGDFWHILFNMIGLYFFGPRLEARIGPRDFVRLYFLAGLAGALIHVAAGLGGAAFGSPFNPWVPLVGASGAVFGVLFGFARYWPDERIMLLFPPIPIRARILVIGLALISLYSGFVGVGRIAHFAHLGGFVGGWLYLKVRERRSEAFRRKATPGAEPTAIERISGKAARDEKRWQDIRVEALHEINRQEVERIQTKIREHGAASLTPDERAFMNRMVD